MRKPSPRSVDNWYADPKDNGIRFVWVDEYSSVVEFFYLPDTPYKFDSPGKLTFWNGFYSNDLGRFSTLENSKDRMLSYYDEHNAE